MVGLELYWFLNTGSAAKIVASLNILFNGFMPEKPLEQHIKDHGSVHVPGNFSPPIDPHHVHVPVRCALVEVRGDWKFVRELFNLSTGWNSTYLCHHCFARKDDYLQFPPDLANQPRRDLDSFLMVTRVPNEPSH